MPEVKLERKQKSSAARPKERDTSQPIPGWAIPAAYVILTAVLFREFIVSGDMLYGSDTMALGYFARDFYANFISSLGEFPLWNPLIFGGIPFLDGMHGDVFYPTTLLLFLQDTHRALGWKLLLHFPLAGSFTYLWLRGLGLARGSAFFGGLVYMLGAQLVTLVHPGHDGKLFVATLTPLLFWLTERAVSRRGYADFAWLALGVALLIFTAHMQLAYFAVWGFSLYFLFRLVQIWRAERKGGEVARLFGLYALAGVLGAGAAAVQLVPPLMYLLDSSHRADRTVESTAAENYEYSTQWSLHPEETMGLVVPEFVGANVRSEDGATDSYWGRNPFKLNHEYSGFIPLLLIPLLFLRRRDARTWFFAGLGVFSLLYALGDTTPFFRLYYALIPGVSLFRAPSSIAFLIALSIATLGAFGLARFLAWAREGEAERRAAGRYLWIATAVTFALALLASTGALTSAWTSIVYADITPDRLAVLERNLPNIQAGFWITFLLAGLTAAIWEGLSRGAFGARVALTGLALLAIFDLWRVDQTFITTVDPSQYFAADETVGYLQTAQQQEAPFRVWDVGALIGAYGPHNRWAIHGIEMVSGHHGNELGRYRALLGGEQPANAITSDFRLLALLNAPYIVTPQPLVDNQGVDVLQSRGYSPVFRGSRSLVYRREDALPRAFLVGDVEVVDDAQAVDRILSADFDFRATAALPEPLPSDIAIEPEPEGSVEWIERGANRLQLRVSTDRPALLVLLDNYYPAWQAEVEGSPAPVLRANYTFRAVPIPAGEHDVVFEYRSDALRASFATSIATLVLLLGVGVGGALRSRAGRPTAPADSEAKGTGRKAT